MNIHRVGVLLSKEIWHGSKSFFFFQAVLTPLVMTIVINLLFGTYFTGKPKLGIVDLGESKITALAIEEKSLQVYTYANEMELKSAVKSGRVDVGFVLEKDLDVKLKNNQGIELPLFVYGESFLITRSTLEAMLMRWLREISGIQSPINTNVVTIGDADAMSWKDRIMPLIVLLAMMMGGLILPGTSIGIEKEMKTIKALAITPVSIGEIFLAKGLMGFITSFIMGIMILLLNNAVGNHSGLLILLLALGAAMAASLGTLIGSFIHSVESYFSVVKPLMMLVYAPGILVLFPQVPGWISAMFPTHYILNPVITITQKGGSLRDVILEACIAVLMTLGVIIFVKVRIGNPIMQTS